MSQMGMQMPGGGARRVRGGQLDVFAVLAFLAVVALGVACVMVAQAAQKVGKDGSLFSLQPAAPTQADPIKLKK